jgi:hypothetical protein
MNQDVYITSLEELLWGGILVTLTIFIHGFCMLLVLRISEALKERFAPNPGFTTGMFVVLLGGYLIFIVHLSEVFIWSTFFFQTHNFSTRSLSYYFALMDYTCLGSNYNLLPRWRLLEGMIGIAGLLTFAWSTGVLLLMAQDFQDTQLQRIKKRRSKGGAKSAAVEHDPRISADL